MVLFLIPSLSLPLINFEYDGVGSYLITTGNSLDVKLGHVGKNLYNYTPNRFYGVLNSSAFFISNFVCPAVASFSACLIVYGKSTSRNVVRVLRWAFTFSMVDALVVGVLFVAPEIEKISRWIFDDTISLCETLTEDTGDDCLVIKGSMSRGGWYLLAFAVAFDCFILGTLLIVGGEEARRRKEEQLEEDEQIQVL